MTQPPPAGWYPDGHGHDRYWDGRAWTEHTRPPIGVKSEEPESEGLLEKIGGFFKDAIATRKAEKAERARLLREIQQAAGRLATSGVFGTSTVEIYEGGYVRVASWPDGSSESDAKPISDKTPYEKLRTITFAEAGRRGRQRNDVDTGMDMGGVVSGLLMGGKLLRGATPAGLAITAASTYVASSRSGKATLTIGTDRQIHTLTNQAKNAIGMKVTQKDHNEVGFSLAATGNAVLEALGFASRQVAQAAQVVEIEAVATVPSPEELEFAEQIRELAALHREGILSDEEFKEAKARV